jgi:hypothetical protein
MNWLGAAPLPAFLLALGGAATTAEAQGQRPPGAARAQFGPSPGAARAPLGVSHRHWSGPRTHVVAPRAHYVRPRTHVGVFVGVPLFPPVYYYPPPPLIAAAPLYAPPPVYVERYPPAPEPQAYWYYCRDAQAYHPYVQQCTSPWERVIPHTPAAPEE